MTSASTSTTGWQLEEGSATAYERFLVTTFMDRWATDLLTALDVQPGERLLDIGCGTGIVSRRAAPLVGQEGAVVGVDVNPAMLQVARSRTAAEGLAVEYEAADATDLPLPDASAEVICSQCMLQFISNPSAAVAEMQRVLIPGGRIGISTCRSLAHQPGYAVLADVITHHIGAEAGAIVRSPFELGQPERLRGLVADAGFTDVQVRIAVWEGRFTSAEALLRGETASSPLGSLVAELDRDVQQRVIAVLTDALADHTDDDGVVFPFETVVAIARRDGTS